MSDVINTKWRMCLLSTLPVGLWEAPGGEERLADNAWTGQLVGGLHCRTNRKTSVSYSAKSSLCLILGGTQLFRA